MHRVISGSARTTAVLITVLSSLMAMISLAPFAYASEAAVLDITPNLAINMLPYDTDEIFTVTVRDNSGLGLPDQVVSLSTTFGTLSASSVITNSEGTASFSIYSNVAGTTKITATLGSLSDVAFSEWRVR